MVEKGDRIELVSTDDPYTNLKSGDRGTVVGIGKIPAEITPDNRPETQIHVEWDNGSNLSLIMGRDSYKVVEGGGGDLSVGSMQYSFDDIDTEQAFMDIKRGFMQIGGIGEQLAGRIANVLVGVADTFEEALRLLATDERIMMKVGNIFGIGVDTIANIFRFMADIGLIVAYSVEDVFRAVAMSGSDSMEKAENMAEEVQKEME